MKLREDVYRGGKKTREVLSVALVLLPSLLLVLWVIVGFGISAALCFCDWLGGGGWHNPLDWDLWHEDKRVTP